MTKRKDKSWEGLSAKEIHNDLQQRLSRRLKRQIRKSYNYDTESYNMLLERKFKLQEEMERMSDFMLSDKPKSQEDRDRAFKMMQEMKSIDETLKEIKEQFKNNLEYTQKQINNQKSIGHLNAVEKKNLQEYRNIYEFEQKLIRGIQKKYWEFFFEDFDLILKASEGDQNSKHEVFKKLERFKFSIQKQYRLMNVKITDGDFYRCMMEAIDKRKKNKYLSQKEWIKGLVRRKLKEIAKEELKYKDRLSDDDPDDLLKSESDESIEGNIYKILPGNNGYIWIEQMAEFIDVSPQTLRNWHNKGIYEARKLPKEWGESYQKYNVYITSDIKPLMKIKEDRVWRGNQAIKGFSKINDVANQLEISIKTIKRMEKAGQLPLPKRDNNNHRIYNKNDIKRIQKNLKRSPKQAF